MAQPGYEGWRALGEAIAGGDRGRAGDAYGQALNSVYKSEDALQQARRSRALALIDQDRYSARTGITPEALGALGFSEAASPVLSNIMRSNGTVSLSNLGDFQRPGYDTAATIAQVNALGESPDIPAYNRAVAYMEGKQYDPIVQEGGVLRPDGVALGDPGFSMTMTPQAAARVEADKIRANAAAAASYASAGASNARAGLYGVQTAAGGWNPNSGSSGGKAPAYSQPSEAGMAAAFGDDEGVVSPDRAREFYAWQGRQAQLDPKYNDGDYALSMFLDDKPALTGEAIELGGKRVELRQGQTADEINTLAQAIRDRRDEGLPELTNAQRVAAIRQYRKTGTMSFGGGRAPAAPAPAAPIAGRVRRVSSPEEAKSIWSSLKPGEGIAFPNGTIRMKE